MQTNIKHIKSSIFYSIGTLGSKVVMFAIVPFLSFFLETKDLGQYDLILVSITFFTPLITIQISDATYRFLLDAADEAYQNRIISTALGSILIGYVLFLCVAFFINKWMDFEHIIEFVVLQLCSCFYVFVQQLVRGLKKNKWYAIMGTLNAIFLVLLTVLFLNLSNLKLKGVLYALIFAQASAIFITVSYNKMYHRLTLKLFDLKTIKQLVEYSWPLLPNALSWWLIDLGNRYLILFYLDDASNGIYAVAARYAGIVAIINAIFILTWQDYIISSKEEVQKSISKSFNRFMVFELSLIVCLATVSREIIEFTTYHEYHDAGKYLSILFLSSGIAAFCGYFGAIYLKEKDTFRAFTTTIIGALVNLTFSLLLINILELYAVALGSVIGFGVTLMLRIRYFKVLIDKKKVTINLFTFAIIFVQQLYIDNKYLSIFLLTATSIAFLSYNRQIIKSIKEIILKKNQ